MAKIQTSSFNGGEVVLSVDLAARTFDVTNGSQTQAAEFLVYDSTGATVVWTFQQAANSSSLSNPIPTVDNNNNPINWQVGQVTDKAGNKQTTVVSPPWSFTMVG